jgi:penicillin-binding protein 1A
MESLLAKIFATALALSQVTTSPDAVKTQFDRSRDEDEVAQLLRAGCTHMRKAFDIEDINLEDLIATAMDDSQAIADENKAFRGINFADLETAYRQFCKNEQVPVPAVDLGDVIDFYNNAASDLPDHTKLKGMKLPGASIVLDGAGQPFAEVFEENQRRVWVPLADIPEQVQKAFLAAEDKRFYQHKGIDERGLIRAFVGNLAQSGRPQGGSTITQQIVKNLLVGDDLTYERKIREMIVASRVEQSLSKAEILELYLNFVYLGRGSWGIEMAARSYFGKPASDLQLEEGALLAGLVKGPNYFSPDRHPGRARERLAYVLSRLQEDGATSTHEPAKAMPLLPTLVAHERPRRDIGFYFMDQVGREAKAIAGIDAIAANSYTVRSTINPQLQRAVEGALQEGLSHYERNAGRVEFGAAEANLAQAVQRLEASKTDDRRPAWQRALANARLPLYDVHWTPAVLVEKPSGKKGEAWRVGLPDGRVLPLAIDNAAAKRKLVLYDVVLVRIAEDKGKAADTRAELRVRPVVQGAVVVLENKTGRILAMTGGFSYPPSQLNRATQAVRQPGSAIKPLSYLAALGKGLQPNTLVMDESITLPSINGSRARDKGYWTPRNYDGRSGATLTLRRAIENSRNLATVRLLDGGIESKPEASLSRLCDLAVEAKIYRECLRYYPFVLGAQPVRPIDLTAFYASIANEGVRPAPHVVDSIERDGQTIYRHDEAPAVTINSVDRAAFYQLKTMLQGVLARGTARAIAGLAPYVAGKTGTTDDENDAWFVGFTNDVTVAVWIGYDNADGKRRTLGGGATGGHVAVPIFEPVIEAAWANVAPRTALAPPSPEAKRQLACTAVDLDSGKIQSGRRKAVSECFRVDAKGRILDTQYRLVARDSAHIRRDGDESISRDKRDRELSASANSSERAYAAEYGWPGDLWRRAPEWDSRADNIQRWGSEQRWDNNGQRWDNEQRWNNARRYRDDQRDWRRTDPTYIWGGHRYD